LRRQIKEEGMFFKDLSDMKVNFLLDKIVVRILDLFDYQY